MGAPYRILIADSEPAYVDLIEKMFSGIEFQIYKIDSGSKVVEYVKAVLPQLVLLEVELPEVDGIEICKSIKSEKPLSNIIIAFLTNKSDDYIQVAAFKAGCDDYILKTTKPRLLAYRISALLKRQHDLILSTDNTIEKNNNSKFYIDPEKFVVVIDSKNVYLPKKQFLLLQYLASNPSKVFSRENIFHYIWGYNNKVGLRTIDVYIRKIRERIGLKYIKTIKGVGYRFE